MMQIVIACLLVVFSSGSQAQQKAPPGQMNQDSTYFGDKAQAYVQLIDKMRTVSSQVSVDMTPLQQVCLPGPDGWVHVYGDGKTGAAKSNACADDLHLQCTYNPTKGQYYVTKAVWGCNPNHPIL